MLGLRDTLRELAKHPDGVHSSNVELSRWGSTQVCAQARALVARGELFSAKLGHRHARFFASAEHRDAYIVAATKRPANRAQHMLRAGVAPWPADAPMHYPEHYAFTPCPEFTPRYQEHTFSFVHGGLRCA